MGAHDYSDYLEKEPDKSWCSGKRQDKRQRKHIESRKTKIGKLETQKQDRRKEERHGEILAINIISTECIS